MRPDRASLWGMELWLLRHAEAEDRAASGRDQDRRLTAAGLEQAEAAGRGIAAASNGIRLVLTSPYARARQTAPAPAPALRIPGSRSPPAPGPQAEPDE